MSLAVRDRFAGVGSAPARDARVAELGQIIHAYSEVTERLQKSHEQLQATVARLQGELGEKNRLLERRNRLAALGEMAAGMAHEIRNPLGGIQLYATMLDADLADRPEQRKIVGKISGGVRRLEGLREQRAAVHAGDHGECPPVRRAGGGGGGGGIDRPPTGGGGG